MENKVAPKTSLPKSEIAAVGRWLSSVSERTARGYKHDLQVFLPAVGKRLCDLTTRDIADYMKSLEGASIGIQLRALTVLKSLLQFCYNDGTLDSNVAASVRRTVTPKLRSAIPSVADVAALLAAMDLPRDRVLVNIIYQCAISSSEASRLRWKDFRSDGVTGILTISGGERPRAIELPIELWASIQELRGKMRPSEPVFMAIKTLAQLDERSIARVVRDGAERAGLPPGLVSVQGLKVAHVRHALDDGVGAQDIQDMLGQRSSRSIERIRQIKL